MFQPDVAVLQLVLAKFFQRGTQLVFGVVQCRDLFRVVCVDRLLDGHRAGHRCALAQRGRHRAKCEPGKMPKRQHRRRPDAAACDQVGEPVEMLLLLRLHLTQHRRLFATAKHGELAGIDTRRAVFASMIHTDHSFDRHLGRHVAGKALAGATHAAVVRSRHRKTPSAVANVRA